MSQSILKMANGCRVVSAYIQETIVSGMDASTYPQTGVVLAQSGLHWVTWRVMFNTTSGCWDSYNGRYFEQRYTATLNFNRRIHAEQDIALVGE